MNSSPLFLASVSWAIISAVGVAVLGGASLLGGRARPRGAFAFGLFSLLWGAQITLANAAGLVTSPATVSRLHLLSLAFLLPLPYLLVEFTASQVEPDAHRRTWWTLRGVAVAAALAAAILLVVAPSLVYGGLEVSSFGLLPDWGVLRVPLVQVPLFGAFAVALLVLDRNRRKAPTTRTRGQALILAAGLALYVGYTAGNNLVFYLISGVDAGTVSSLLFPLLFLGLATVSLAVGGTALRRSLRAPTPEEASHDRWMAAAVLVPLTWGALEAVVSSLWLPTFYTVGLWRLTGVAVIAYGFARWRLFDLPQRAQRAGASGAGVAVALAGGAAGYGAGTMAFGGVVTPALLGVLVTGATLVPSVRLTRRAFATDTTEGGEGGVDVYGQRIDTYRSAVEASLARGSLEEDQGFLLALRQRFQISDDVADVIHHYARSAVLLPREEGEFGRYERLRLLGEGGGGRTWLARDRTRENLVVLKEPLHRWQRDPSLHERVLQEARLAAKVRHPNVVRIEEVIDLDGLPIIIMEYLEAGSLADVLRQGGELPWRRGTELILDVLRGLHAVHEEGILHRDVKPSNILLDGAGVAKVGDFGIATQVSADKTLIDGTSYAGTMAYMAPEALEGTPPDRRGDVYAAAAVLHECVVGRPPEPGSPHRRLDSVPEPLREPLRRGLARDPETRFPDARSLARALQSALEGEEVAG